MLEMRPKKPVAVFTRRADLLVKIGVLQFMHLTLTQWVTFMGHERTFTSFTLDMQY